MNPLILALGGVLLVVLDNVTKPLGLATVYGIILLTVAASLAF